MYRPLLLLLPLALGCRSSTAAPAATAGNLNATWADSAGTARFTAPAEARWCARDSMLEVLAVRGDTAVGLALYARDSLRAEGYSVFQASAYAPMRPQATVALRLVTTNALRPFESGWGQVMVTEAGARRASGTFDLHLRLLSGTDSVHLTGSFDRLAILPAASWCGRAIKPIPR